MINALRQKGILFVHGSNARNCAMINSSVILLRSIQTRRIMSITRNTLIIIVFFTRRMNAKKRRTSQRELKIINFKKMFEKPSLITLESGVVFVVRLVEERMIMHALTLHIQKNKSPEIPQAYSLNFWTTPITSCVRREHDEIVFRPEHRTVSLI